MGVHMALFSLFSHLRACDRGKSTAIRNFKREKPHAFFLARNMAWFQR